MSEALTYFSLISTGEKLKEGGIPPDEQEFQATAKQIGELGDVVFTCTRAFLYGRSDRGFAVVEGRLLEESSVYLRNAGFFEAFVSVNRLQVPTWLDGCRILLPLEGSNIEMVSKFVISSDECDESDKKYAADTSKWLVPGYRRRHNLFVNPDLSSLAAIKFKFDFVQRPRTPKTR